MDKTFKRLRLPIEKYVEGILSGDRVILSRAITLIESQLVADNELAEELLNRVLSKTGHSIRIGITGVPGAGKSTLIESFGKYLTHQNKKVAVLTIDPSSQRTKGSILGDKTRMEALANDPNAYVRPSSSGSKLGGVHSKTRETMLLCEAAGFEVIIIETVGVGQSETSVKGIVDFFLLLALAGAGDELQGIKRGIMEMADSIAINKADGDNIKRSQMAKQNFVNALHMFPPNVNGWIPQVHTCSALNNKGIEDLWEIIQKFEAHVKANGWFEKNRQEQNIEWMNDLINYHLLAGFFSKPDIKTKLERLKVEVKSQKLPAITAARLLIEGAN